MSAETLSLTRREWRADPLDCRAGAVLEPERWIGAVLHHDVIDYAPTANVEEVIEHAQAVQRARPDLFVDELGRPEWPYSFGIGEHPNPELAWVVEGRGIARTGAHTAGLNSTRYGIVIFGNYSERALTPGMVRAFRALCAWALAPALAAGIELAPTLGHRQVAATACPGLTGFASVPRLQPPFRDLTPATNPGEPEMELDDAIDLREPKAGDVDQFTMTPSTVRGALEFANWHARRADAFASSAAGWAHVAATSVQELAAAIKAAPAGNGEPIAVEALSLALRAVLTPELVAAALVELVRRLPS